MKPVFQWVYATPTQPQASPATAPPAAAAETRAGNAAISDRIEQAFGAASTSTGTSFDYLVKTAQRESAMNPSAKARTSSATGLFQFIESTWLETMKLSGHEFGLGDVADKISVSAEGRYRVTDPEERKAILDMRKDPEISAMMAGALTRRNAIYLADKLGRQPNAGELYIAHFLGAAGAASLIGLAEARPEVSAADYFPRQAAANKSIFYQKGQPLSASDVYAGLVKNHSGPGMDIVPPDMMTAFAAAVPPVTATTGTVDPMKGESAQRVDAGWQAAAAEDPFTALFRNDRAPPPSVAVSAYWQAFAVTPALFDVAIAEDEKLLGARHAEAFARAEDASLLSRAGIDLTPDDGPLDLSKFLDTDDT